MSIYSIIHIYNLRLFCTIILDFFFCRACNIRPTLLGSLIVKPKQAGSCGRSIRNEHTSTSLICTNIKYYRTYSIYSLSRLYAILLSITKKTACEWKSGIEDDTSCSAHKCQLVLVLL